MAQSHFSLTWDSYKSSICYGFSALQQNGEFVDMTLAADGHFVKVHQVLVALASPYLKELITSAPCQHPVIFLNNVSYKNLSLLLEYIYTGEVLVPAENLASFAEAAGSLFIKGLEKISNENHNYKMATDMTPVQDELCHITGVKKVPIPSTILPEQVNLPAAARKIYIKRESTGNVNSSKQESNTSKTQDVQDFLPMDDSSAHNSDDGFQPDTSTHATREQDIKATESKPSSNLQFSVSIRGSLQVILNRYIYNLHSSTMRTGQSVRRWRCVDYRNNKCTAFVVTNGNIVLNRANLHNHSFHDKKILAKIEKKCVFSAIDDVEGYKEKEMNRDSITDTDVTMEDENFIGLESFREEIKKTTVSLVKHT